MFWHIVYIDVDDLNIFQSENKIDRDLRILEVLNLQSIGWNMEARVEGRKVNIR